MRQNYYDEFVELIRYELVKICTEFKSYTYTVKREVLEERASKKTYSGYENKKIVKKFEKEVQDKLDLVLEYTSNQFDKLNRKLSEGQREQLSKMVFSHFQSIICQFENELPNLIGEVSETIKSGINSMNTNTRDKIYNYFAVMNFTRKYYYDKYFFWTVFSAGVSVASMIISVLIWIFEVWKMN